MPRLQNPALCRRNAFHTILACIQVSILACMPLQAQAANKSQEAEAMALLTRAQAYIKQHGMAAAFAEFNRLDSPFNVKSDINPYGDLYLFSLDYKGYQAVHGKNPNVRGQVMLKMRDQNGVFIIREMANLCKKAGKGQVAYVWPHPLHRTLEQKLGLIERIPGTEICIGTGIYR